jgi:hypothetical protein
VGLGAGLRAVEKRRNWPQPGIKPNFSIAQPFTTPNEQNIQNKMILKRVVLSMLSLFAACVYNFMNGL